MAEFLITDDGQLAEKAVHELAQWYSEQCPGIDSETFEAHLMVLRAQVALATPRPSSPIGSRVTRAQYNVLRLLYQSEDKRLLMSEIGKGLNVSPTNTTKLVDQLVRAGRARRVANPDDKRSTWAELTEKGRTEVETVLPDVGRATNELWSTLSREEKRVLVHLLAKLRLNFFTLAGDARTMELASPGSANGSRAPAAAALPGQRLRPAGRKRLTSQPRLTSRSA
jgi:MarR family 2-MHQ and catechol resistance regulon transcriptional repressor